MGSQFLGLNPGSKGQEKAKTVIIPVPFDRTVCYQAGARNGPEHIIAASPHMEFYDEEMRFSPVDFGIFTQDPVEPILPPEKTVEQVKERVSAVLDLKKLPVVIGGEHSITIGAVEAALDHFPDLVVVQFDAHTDLREEYQGSRYSHACTMRRIWPKAHVVQLGIRSCSAREIEFLESQNGPMPFWAKDCIFHKESIIKKLIERIDGKPVYVTIDLDCLDPSIMPAVGTPEPGGLGWYDMLFYLKALAKEHVIGFDLVELSPIPGLYAADFTAARLLYKFLAYLLSKNLKK